MRPGESGSAAIWTEFGDLDLLKRCFASLRLAPPLRGSATAAGRHLLPSRDCAAFGVERNACDMQSPAPS